MSEQNKTRYEIQKILIECIKLGLQRLGLSNPSDSKDKWQIQEFANASFTNGDRLILLNMIREELAGWQFSETSKKLVDNNVVTYENRVAIQSWQIHCLAKFKEDVPNSIVATDMANRLKFWLNSNACLDFLRSKGVSMFRIDDYSIIVYNDNSDIYQKRAVINIKLCVPQRQELLESIVADLNTGIYPV